MGTEMEVIFFFSPLCLTKNEGKKAISSGKKKKKQVVILPKAALTASTKI